MHRHSPRSAPRFYGDHKYTSSLLNYRRISCLPKMRGCAGYSGGSYSCMCAHARVMRMYVCVFSVRLLRIIFPLIPAIEING